MNELNKKMVYHKTNNLIIKAYNDLDKLNNS